MMTSPPQLSPQLLKWKIRMLGRLGNGQWDWIEFRLPLRCWSAACDRSHTFSGPWYCTISFNSDKGVTCDILSEILVSDTFQNDGDRVIPPPARRQSRPLIALFSIGAHQCFRTKAMWHRTLVTFRTIWRGLWRVTSELNEMVQYVNIVRWC